VAALTGPAPRTIADLHAEVSMIFHCMVGQPRAYMEIPLTGLRLHVRGVYRTYRWIAKGSRPDFEATLCEFAWRQLVAFHQRLQAVTGGMEQFPLFWRSVPSIEEVTEGDHVVGTDANGSPVTEYLKARVGLRMRLWVPGLWEVERDPRETVTQTLGRVVYNPVEPVYVN